jgi:hypothetical protein
MNRFAALAAFFFLSATPVLAKGISPAIKAAVADLPCCI